MINLWSLISGISRCYFSCGIFGRIHTNTKIKILISGLFQKRYQGLTKDFLQDHINKLFIDEKCMNK